MRALTRPLLAAMLLSTSAGALACPICLGWGQPSVAQRLVEAPQAVLAVPTADSGRFRVITTVTGERPANDTIDGDYPRNGRPGGAAAPAGAKPLLLVRVDPFPTWTILGAIDPARADWLRALAAGKRTADMGPQDWRDRFALVLPHLDDPEALAADLAYAELAAAPYVALRAAKPQLDAASFRPCLLDPELAARQPLRLLLLGISGNAQDAAALELRLETAWQSGDAAGLGATLTADLELRGAERMAWIESKYLADRSRSPAEIKAALLALSVHGGAGGVIPRERVIQSYRVFMKAHPETAGYVAPDLAAWQYWDAAADYVALLRSGVRQQYPSQAAILAYLRQCPGAEAQTFKLQPAPADGVAERSDSPLPQP